MVSDEVFLTIPNFTDYVVSNFGRVKTKARKLRYLHARTNNEHFRQTEERFLKVHMNARTGYKFYQLYNDQKMYNRNIHRLVMTTFVSKPDGLDYINHKDGNKHNNTIENLEWCTNEYNHEHATRTGLKSKGSEIALSKLTERSVHAVKYFLSKGCSHNELSKAFKVSRSTITLINIGETWRHVALTGTELEINL